MLQLDISVQEALYVSLSLFFFVVLEFELKAFTLSHSTIPIFVKVF
jgi:hypothetical protein